MSSPKNKKYLTGLPRCLHPAAKVKKDTFAIISDGPRNLELCPFDFRNPFPLHDLKAIQNEFVHDPDTRVQTWPITDDDPAFFNYYCSDNAAIGLPGGPECALIDIFGTLRVFTGAWAFALGPAKIRPELRLRYLFEGDKPIILAEIIVDDVKYQFEYFAVDIPDSPDCDYFERPQAAAEDWQGFHWIGALHPRGRNIFLHTRVTASLATDQPCSAEVLLGFAQRPALACGGFFENPPIAPEWKNLKLTTPKNSSARLTAQSDLGAYTLGLITTNNAYMSSSTDKIDHWPTPIRRVHVDRTAQHHLSVRKSLKPGQTLVIDCLVPHFPLETSLDSFLQKTQYKKLHSRAIAIWHRRRSETIRIQIPEPKVQDAFYQAINNLDLCSVKIENSEFPAPGPSGGYHNFYERDSIDMIYAYDLLGEFDRARRMIDHYSHYSIGQESCGMFLWLLGRHLRLTGDTAWASVNFSEVTRRMTWIMSTWLVHRDSNGGLLPDTGLGDNECIKGHFVSYHIYSLAGIIAAIDIARALDQADLASKWNQFYTEFRSVVFARFAELVKNTGGVITPAFEGFKAEHNAIKTGAYGSLGGIDWHNIGVVFPTNVLPPDHPWVDSSLARWRHAYIEGTFAYPHNSYDNIHNYNGINLSETWLRRGDYAETLRDIYGLLLHTSATHGSAEVVVTSERFDHNCVPHNWFSGKFIRFVRDCLAYEGHDDMLHILGCLAPAWMNPGSVVAIENAPTDFGFISYSALMRSAGMIIDIDFKPRSKSHQIAIHLPPFLASVVVKVKGRTIRKKNNAWIIPAGTKKVDVSWKPCRLPDISFTAVAQSYIQDYKKRVDHLTSK